MRALFLLLAAACASPTPVVSRDRLAALSEVDESAVANCTKVGRLVGVSAIQGEAGMVQARESARAKAIALGATHVVTAEEWQTPDAATAAVYGYHCP